MAEIQTNKSLLNNVAIIRPLLIVLLVFYHAFVIYQGGWGAEGVPDIKTYWWLDKLSYAFMLETFVFVSGYVFGFQVRTKGEGKLLAKNLFWNKFKRLIVPSMVFSLVYILLFQDISQDSVSKTIFSIIEGVGHMWFLPMLFWCFVGIWIIEKLRLKPAIVIPLLILCSIVSFIPLPLQLNAAMYFMLFFYVGYLFQRQNLNLCKFYTYPYAISLVLAFAILFPSLTIFREQIDSIIINNGGYLIENQLVGKFVEHSVLNIAKMMYSSVGLAMLFVIIGIIEKRLITPLPQWFVRIGGLCMGVYLFQQFILMGLYRYTALPSIIGYFWLPWVGFVVALVVSLGLSYMMRLTKVGRFLIG